MKNLWNKYWNWVKTESYAWFNLGFVIAAVLWMPIGWLTLLFLIFGAYWTYELVEYNKKHEENA